MQQLGTTPDGKEVVSCASCDGIVTRVRYHKFDMQLVECVRCGLVYINPRQPKEIVHTRYNPEYFHKEYLPAQGVIDGHVDLAQLTAHHAPMLTLLEARAGRKGSLFEIGAGAGLFLAVARSLGWEARGIELSTEAVRFGQERLGVDLREGTAEELPLAGAQFDAVVMFDVIEHLFDPVAVLRAIRPMLRPGGVVAISTPNFDALSRHALGEQWAILSPLEHLYYFNERTLQGALAKSGFVEIKSVRRHEGWNVFHAMNARNTHKPGSARATAYGAAVRILGPSILDWVRRTGHSDMLLVTAIAPGSAGKKEDAR